MAARRPFGPQANAGVVAMKVHALLAILCATLPLAVQAVPLAVRTGGWEMTVTTSVGGAAQLPPSLTPEQKARLEEAFKKRAAAPRTNQFKSCVTKEDLDSERAFQKDEDCRYTISTRSATRWAGTAVCRHDDTSSQADFDIQAKGAESIVMTMNSRVAQKGNAKGPSEIRMEMTGRWASPSCKGYDD
jgi:hypothetical protein